MISPISQFGLLAAADNVIDSPIWTLAWSKAGFNAPIAAGGLSGTVGLFDASLDALYGRKVVDHGLSTLSTAFSGDGSVFASSSFDSTIECYSMGSPRGPNCFATLKPVHGERGVAFDPAFGTVFKRRLASAGHKGLSIWNLDTKERATGAFVQEGVDIGRGLAVAWVGSIGRGTNASVNSLTPLQSPFSATLVVSHSSGHVAVFKDSEKLDLSLVLKPHSKQSRAVAFLDENTFLTASDDKLIKLNDMRTQEPAGSFSAHLDYVTSLSVRPNSNADNFLSTGLDGSLKLWDVHAMRCLASIRPGHCIGAEVWACDWDESGERAVVGGGKGGLEIYEVEK